MIVYLPSVRVSGTERFWAELKEMPEEARIVFWDSVERYLKGERLSSKFFKTFRIDGKNKILEFKMKSSSGNWRAISVFHRSKLVFVYAFYKKSQQLLEQDKETIRARIGRLE